MPHFDHQGLSPAPWLGDSFPKRNVLSCLAYVRAHTHLHVHTFYAVICSKLLPAFEFRGGNGKAKKTRTAEGKAHPTFQVSLVLLTKPVCLQGPFGINAALTNIFAAGLVLMKTVCFGKTSMQNSVLPNFKSLDCLSVGKHVEGYGEMVVPSWCSGLDTHCRWCLKTMACQACDGYVNHRCLKVAWCFPLMLLRLKCVVFPVE